RTGCWTVNVTGIESGDPVAPAAVTTTVSKWVPTDWPDGFRVNVSGEFSGPLEGDNPSQVPAPVFVAVHEKDGPPVLAIVRILVWAASLTRAASVTLLGVTVRTGPVTTTLKAESGVNWVQGPSRPV